MPLRKMKAKKYKGIYEYYRTSDPDKAVVAYYISVRQSRGAEAKKIKTDATTADEARLVLMQYKTLRSNNVPVQNIQMTFTQLADDFFADAINKNKINSTRDKKRFEIHINPVIGAIKLSNLSGNDMSNLQAYLLNKLVPVTWNAKEDTVKMSPKTINDTVDLAYRISNWGYKKQKMSKRLEPVNKLEIDNARKRIFTAEEMDLIFENVEGDTMIFLKLAYHTAQRPQSIIRLQMKHIINGEILIEAIKHQRSHLIPMSTKLGSVLIPWIKNLDTDDYIITRTKLPMPYQTIQGRISKLFGKLFNEGLSYRDDAKQWASLYTIRHTALTNLYRTTKDIQVVQIIGNHSDPRVTQRYVKGDNEIKKNALEGL